jgi:anti-sigma factor RsiW
MKENTQGCPRIDALSALIDEALAENEAAEIRAHAATCPLCGAALADLHRVRTAFARMPMPVLGRDLAAEIGRRIDAARPAAARPRARPRWSWTAAPVAAGGALALSVGVVLGSLLVAGGSVATPRAGLEAFATVPPGGICLAQACLR